MAQMKWKKAFTDVTADQVIKSLPQFEKQEITSAITFEFDNVIYLMTKNTYQDYNPLLITWGTNFKIWQFIEEDS